MRTPFSLHVVAPSHSFAQSAQAECLRFHCTLVVWSWLLPLECPRRDSKYRHAVAPKAVAWDLRCDAGGCVTQPLVLPFGSEWSLMNEPESSHGAWWCAVGTSPCRSPNLCMCSASSVTKYPEFVGNRLRGSGARCEDPQPGAIGSGPHQYGDVTGDPWRWVLTG